MKITAKQATAMLKRAPKLVAAVAPKAALIAAQRTRTALIKVSPVDTGGFKNAWRVYGPTGSTLARVENDHPIAGVIEDGARPHPVSFEGQAAIKAWVIRKGFVEVQTPRGRTVRVTKRNVDRYEAAVDSVVFLICRKLREKGQKGLHLVRNVIPAAEAWFRLEVERLVQAEVSKVPR